MIDLLSQAIMPTTSVEQSMEKSFAVESCVPLNGYANRKPCSFRSREHGCWYGACEFGALCKERVPILVSSIALLFTRGLSLVLSVE